MSKQAFIWPCVCREEQTATRALPSLADDTTTDALFNAGVFSAGHLLSCLNSSPQLSTSCQSWGFALLGESSHRTNSRLARDKEGSQTITQGLWKPCSYCSLPCSLLWVLISNPLYPCGVEWLHWAWTAVEQPLSLCREGQGAPAWEQSIPFAFLNLLWVWRPQEHELYLISVSKENGLSLHGKVLPVFVSAVGMKIYNLIQMDLKKRVSVLFQMSDMLGLWACNSVFMFTFNTGLLLPDQPGKWERGRDMWGVAGRAAGEYSELFAGVFAALCGLAHR